MGRLKFSLEQRQKQNLQMTQQLREAIGLLQLSNVELSQHIRQYMESNPFLEMDMPPETSMEDSHPPDENSDFSDSLFADRHDSPVRRQKEISDAFSENMLPTKKTLQAHLEEQLNTLFLSEAEKAIGQFIIYNINERGYLDLSSQEIAETLGTSILQVERLLSLIQAFDPVGVGARHVCECLKAQLQEKGALTPTLEKILTVLDNLPHVGPKVLAKRNGFSETQLLEALKVLKKLDPFPGLQYDFQAPQAIIPDVLIHQKGSEFMVEVNPAYLPKPLLNRAYYAVVKEKTKGDEERRTIQGYYNEATWLLNALNQRLETMLAVSKAIIVHQKNFFLKGIHCLKPLVFQDIAQEIGVHESTISRIVQHKYFLTPRGIFPFRYFFATGFQSRTQAHSSQYIKTMIQSLVETESPDAPLSDDAIVQLFQKKGIEIARRTIAKYRKMLHIPSSTERKRLRF